VAVGIDLDMEYRLEAWLLMEWPEGEAEPTRYWFSTLPTDTPIAVLVDERQFEGHTASLSIGGVPPNDVSMSGHNQPGQCQSGEAKTP
jgi:hypothetical protein